MCFTIKGIGRRTRSNLKDAGVRVLAWCAMTNHVHWVLVPEQEDSLQVLYLQVAGAVCAVSECTARAAVSLVRGGSGDGGYRAAVRGMEPGAGRDGGAAGGVCVVERGGAFGRPRGAKRSS